MPTGPMGAPRPFADGELIYTARYNISRAKGQSMEGADASTSAERRIAQEVEDMTGFTDVAVELYPAGFILAVKASLNGAKILESGSRERGLKALRSSVDQAVKSAVDQNAQRGVGIDQPGWEIYCE